MSLIFKNSYLICFLYFRVLNNNFINFIYFCENKNVKTLNRLMCCNLKTIMSCLSKKRLIFFFKNIINLLKQQHSKVHMLYKETKKYTL